MRGDWTAEPGLYGDLFDLLDLVFPGVRGGAEEIRRFGASWEEASIPYVRREGRRILSHVGVIPLPLIVAGRSVAVGSVHAVATHPDHRRKGYYRELMEEAIADVAARFETLILTTENPEYYEPFGFRILREHRFRASVDSDGRERALRPLDLRSGGDLALLHRLIETRAPVSRMLGAGPAKGVFLFNEARRPLLYCEELDALLCVEREKDRLVLFDVVAPEPPRLEEIVERIPGAVREAVLCFAPDRIAPGAAAEPHLYDYGGPSTLMARGPFAAEGIPFALPRSART